VSEAAALAARRLRDRERRRLLRLHRYEFAAREAGHRSIGGVDEVGRGPLAGPVVACVVVTEGSLMLPGLNDSKQVPPERRTLLAAEIKLRAHAWAIGEASVAEIDRLNIYWASVLAMERAIAALGGPPDYLITDAVRLRSYGGVQLPLVKGDAKSACVAAASIVAKVYRDELLCALDRAFPEYGFAEHKGYATPRHLAALREHGPCEHHRRGFASVREMLPLFPFEAAPAEASAAGPAASLSLP
jgi:ribonuclease HII